MITDKHFIDWEADTFGFGYGTGEAVILPALKTFFAVMRRPAAACSPGYDYREVEAAIGALPAWLLINVLCHADILEYGTSPRFGWLTNKGKLLKEYLDAKTVDELYGLTSEHDDGYTPCYPDHCNCEAANQHPCENPLWGRR